MNIKKKLFLIFKYSWDFINFLKNCLVKLLIIFALILKEIFILKIKKYTILVQNLHIFILFMKEKLNMRTSLLILNKINGQV